MLSSRALFAVAALFACVHGYTIVDTSDLPVLSRDIVKAVSLFSKRAPVIRDPSGFEWVVRDWPR